MGVQTTAIEMFFKLYLVATFFSAAGLLMWYKWRSMKTKRKANKLQKSIYEYGKSRKRKG